MFRKHFILFLTATVTSLIFASCTPQKKLVYLQGDASKLANDSTDFRMKLSPGDIITVDLYTVNPEAFPGIGIMNDKPTLTDNRTPYEKGFLLDRTGKVSLPYIGDVNLAGLTIEEAHDTVTARFHKFIDEPVIVVKKLSFKISVLGEVTRPGLYYVPNEKLTILEALGMAGDLNNFGDRTALTILRKTPEGTIEIKVDLTSKDAYVGASKYIYPDDVIYVAPVRNKAFVTISPATAVLTSIIASLVIIATLIVRTQ